MGIAAGEEDDFLKQSFWKELRGMKQKSEMLQSGR